MRSNDRVVTTRGETGLPPASTRPKQQERAVSDPASTVPVGSRVLEDSDLTTGNVTHRSRDALNRLVLQAAESEWPTRPSSAPHPV